MSIRKAFLDVFCVGARLEVDSLELCEDGSTQIDNENKTSDLTLISTRFLIP
jgi:hypothetical protein